MRCCIPRTRDWMHTAAHISASSRRAMACWTTVRIASALAGEVPGWIVVTYSAADCSASVSPSFIVHTLPLPPPVPGLP